MPDRQRSDARRNYTRILAVAEAEVGAEPAGCHGTEPPADDYAAVIKQFHRVVKEWP